MLNAGFKKKEDGLREELAAAGDAAATARDAAEAAVSRLASAEEVPPRHHACVLTWIQSLCNAVPMVQHRVRSVSGCMRACVVAVCKSIFNMVKPIWCANKAVIQCNKVLLVCRIPYSIFTALSCLVVLITRNHRAHRLACTYAGTGAGRSGYRSAAGGAGAGVRGAAAAGRYANSG